MRLWWNCCHAGGKCVHEPHGRQARPSAPEGTISSAVCRPLPLSMTKDVPRSRVASLACTHIKDWNVHFCPTHTA